MHKPRIEPTLRAAESRVRERLGQRSTLEISAILDACLIPSGLRDQAGILLHALASAIQVDVGKLRHDDVLGELLRAEATELPNECADALKAHKLGSVVEVMWYEVIGKLEAVTAREAVGTQIVSFVGRLPRGEDGYIELMRTLRLARFVLLFSPAVSERAL